MNRDPAQCEMHVVDSLNVPVSCKSMIRVCFLMVKKKNGLGGGGGGVLITVEDLDEETTDPLYKA